jgi:non-ribosomal peptide synthase protein (TIGR01720 family)
VQVGLGYHNRPELTAERFVSDPFSSKRGARLYKTGDKARWTPDGTIEYLGRLDFQVKIRGFRIELGEIESALLAHERVRDCVVVARAGDGGEQRLVAYLVCEGEAPSISTLRTFLLATLPDYMVPSAFVVLDALPLSSNGKVDRRALPDPRLESATRERAYEAPRTPAERTLADIWAKVLRVERVGVTDDFYELGGDSLLSIQIVSQAARAGLRISLTQVLRNPTVAGQALAAQALESARAEPDAMPAQGDVPLTPVQRWFAELDTPDAHHWNQAFLFTVPASIDHARLAAALAAVTAHHDALRLRFRRDADGWRQWYSESAAGDSIALARVDLRATTDDDLPAAIAATCELAQSSLDLEHGPIGRAVHFDLGSSRDGRLALALHHLVVDGVSWRLLREDLESAYEQLEHGEAIALPARTSSFAAWSAQLSALAGSPALHGETSYWVAETAPGTLPLPCDHPRGANVEGEVVVAESWLSAAETRDLLQRVPAAYGTQINDVLVAALGGALATWIGSGSVLVDLEGHGREDVGGGLDLSRTVGWFTSVFPLRLAVARGASPRDRLIAAKERLRAVPGRGLGYGVLRYLREAPSLLEGAQAEVMFNYLGQFDQVVAGSRLFGFAAEPLGAWRSARAKRRHKLEIVALVQDGRLVVRFGYARTVHDAATIDRLAESFATALRGCIAHCLAPDAGGYTPSDFPLAACDQALLDRVLGTTRDVQDVYPLTPIQRMFLDAAGGATDPGLQQYRFDLEGDVDAPALREAWSAVVRRHDVLRTRFVSEGASPLQIVMRRAELPWREEDWRGDADAAGRLAALLREDRAAGIDVSRAPLMRVTLVRTGDARWTMVWTQHHLLLDRWSWPIVLREVGAWYDASRRGSAVSLAPAAPFRDYVAWLAANPDDEAERYWRAELADMGEPLRLLGGRAGGEGEPGLDETVVSLSSAETASLRQAARARGLALNVLLEGAWAIALSHVGARDDVTFGLAVDGRGAEVPRVGEIVGVTINNVPVRLTLDPSRPVGDALAELQRRQADLRAAEHASPEAIQRWSGLEWRHRLFESLVVFQDASAERGMEGWLGGGAKVAAAVTPTETAYPITVLVGGDDRLFMRVLSDRRKVPPALGEQLALAMEAVVRGMGSGLEQSVGALRGALPAVRSWAMDAMTSGVRERVAPRTALESVLARMWGDLLGVGDLGVTDNFLARGGHSLLATQIVSRVRETFQVEVPVRALFQGPTVAELAVVVTGLERKPGQVARIAELIQRVDGMSADELRQSAAARDARARQTAMANGN